ncbi:hypothetical protein OIE63_15200 [Streptomyces sp. NBC_01795]|uniref:hypothetical protein n=1 Tax=Streptomyces sp. NBC_01795 TaxID=2975943 RepID=UPI002DDB1BBE|nr:hypothetical protein [Streptomyces sp. NBC_01795]WSA92758.1 hypothetical protein OIE63_15200 [Streptomyces sp. NBC_01795]
MLYRTPERWRFTVFFEAPGGVADGVFDHPGPSASPETAQTALHLRVEELTHRELEVSWQLTDHPNWWTGAVTKAGPVSDADR